MGGILIGDNLLTLIAASLRALDNNILVYFYIYTHMHSRDSYQCTIPAFGMEIPPWQPGTWAGCGYAGTESSPYICPLHQHRGQNLPAVLSLACQKGHILFVALTAAKHIVMVFLCLKMKEVSEVDGRCRVFPRRSEHKTTAQSWIQIPSLPQLKPDLSFLTCEVKKGKHTVAKKLEKEKGITF